MSETDLLEHTQADGGPQGRPPRVRPGEAALLEGCEEPADAGSDDAGSAAEEAKAAEAEQEPEAAGAETKAAGEEAEAGEEPEAAAEELDPEVRARRDAALRQIRKLGDPVLRAKALPVERFDEQLAEEVKRMGQLMDDALGVGLAATQIGVLHRVLVYRVDPELPVNALVNPVLDWTSEETEPASEGCLSLPGVHVEVERPARVRVSARDPAGRPLAIDAEGLEARVIQHEIDHLDGILILDRISREQRKEAMKAMRRALSEDDARQAA